ncbi:MAG: ketol-acid reductoisomerase [bacterium]
MSATIYYNEDADLEDLEGDTIAVIGYGSQGHAHALNLRDSGLDVIVGLRPDSSSREKAEKAGLRVENTADAVAEADVISFLIPDEVQKSVYDSKVEPNLDEGDMMVFGHGFNIRFDQVVPPEYVDVVLVAPKGPGHVVRSMYVEEIGTPNLIAVNQDATGEAKDRVLAYSRGIGGTWAGAIETTFKEECETDLFGEQTILCGGVSHLIQAAFETLTEAGYQPEIAYFECLHELKLITDLIHEGGIQWMRYSCSDTAEYGDYTRGPRVIDEHVRENMKEILDEVQSGEFAEEWIEENEKGRPAFDKYREEHSEHPVEEVGEKIRGMMPWLEKRVTDEG